MKVLFSNPPWWEDTSSAGPAVAGVRAGSRWPFTLAVRSRPDRPRFGDYLPYPFFLGAAATYAARHTQARVAFRDSLALRESYESFFAFLRQEDFDCIVIESASPSWPHDQALIRRLHARQPRTKILLAGPIACLGQALLDEHPLFAVIQGEYEKGCVKALSGQGGLHPHDLLTPEEFENAPHPYLDPLHAHRYWDANPKGQVFPQAQVLSSRGCPFRCIFCVWPAVMTGNDPDGSGVRSVRRYSPERMADFLGQIVKRYRYESIYFDDDTFNLGDDHVEAMCAVMGKIGLPWSAMCRADTISRPVWRLMRESGCFGVKIGFESGNQWVIDNIVGKNLNLELAREVTFHLKSLGFTVHGTFTVGLPGETDAQRADTVRYRKSLPLDSWQVSGTAEIEGSPLAALGRRGRLARYAGANLDGYLAESDGTRKLRRLADQARSEHAPAAQAPRDPAASAGRAPVRESETLSLLADEATRAGELDAAVGLLARAVQADPADAALCRRLGETLDALGRPDQAALCHARAAALEQRRAPSPARPGADRPENASTASPCPRFAHSPVQAAKG
ncbi:hypothetical protein JCM15519_13460 [Fundidesulfovibrio butyratiphilus]